MFKSITSRRIKVARSCLLLAAAAAGLYASSASAALITWNGLGGTVNWNVGGNWIGGNPPNPGDSLIFDGATQPTNTNDFAANTNFAGITIASTATAAFTLSGNSINLSGDIVQNRVSGTVSNINIPFALQSNINFSVASGGNLTLGAAMTGGFSVTKTGSGVGSFNVAQTFTGGLNISGGTLRSNNSGNTNTTIGTGPVTLDNGAALDLRSTTGTTLNNDLVVGANNGVIAVRTNDTFSPATLTGTGALTFQPDSATLVMTPTDFKTWNGTLLLNNGGQASFGLRLGSSFVATSALNLAIDVGANCFISKQNGTNGTTVIDIGRLSGASTGSLGASAAGTGVFLYSVGARNQDATFAGAIVDGSTKTGIRKVGANCTWILSGTGSNFTGASSVNAGTLQVDGTLTGVTLAMTVNTGGTLSGAGSIAGTVNSVGGSIAPGDSPGTLTMANALSMDSATSLLYQLNGTDTTVGSNINDLISGVTNLTLDGTINISETVPGSFASAANGSTWRLINYTGALTDNGLTIGTTPTLPGGAVLGIDTATPGQVNLVITVPEPMGLSLAAIAGLAFFRRHRRAGI